MNDTINEWLRVALFLPPQSSTVATAIDHLHYFVIITTMLGSAFVGFLAMYFVIRYRRQRGRTPRREVIWHQPRWMEWAVAVGLFSLFVGWWVIGLCQYMRLRVSPPNSYDIYVTAKQWMWKFTYREGPQSIAKLYVPAGRPVQLIMTSRDVIHSFYVPDFRVKQDVLPGRYVSTWFEAREPGRHIIFCAEYCGTNHSTMRGEVIVLSPADYSRWLSSQLTTQNAVNGYSAAPWREEPSVVGENGPSPPEPLARLGVGVAAQEGCLRCHTLDGTPHIGPTFAGMYRAHIRLKDGATVIADDAFLTESMMDPNARIHEGFQSVMPSYLGRLRPAETAALLELIRSLERVPVNRRHTSPRLEGVPPELQP